MMYNDLKEAFLLREDVTFLNFGSFGATPKPIFESYQRFQRELEYEPVQFIINKGPEYLKESRERLGEYLFSHPDNLVYVPNPTYAVNIVARSLDLKAGDEVLSTDIEYGACDRTWEFYCREKGATYVRQTISLPIQSKEAFLADFWKGFSEKTRLVFISQITSATGLILPIKEICEEAKQRGLLVFIDGAHVPGHISLNLTQLDADFYTGACHKWMMTPKGSSFLYVKPEHQDELDPLIISWGYQADYPSHSQFLDYHQFNGTRDFSAYLTIPDAIDFMKMNDWWGVAESCRILVRKWLPKLCDLVGSEPLAPVTDEFIGQMGSIPVRCGNPVELKHILYNEYKIEIPVMVQNNQVYIRYSINAFNSEEDLNILEKTLKDLKKRTLIF
ncbi:aminotransferase class V-fold PLP-dependent enzyme [Fluviicola chungangensis]|uniref:Aminotransferase class V-fold PLP-dependent enzyme n=1 Tax=Fluviicola chungangensis TaxID=2597671 RepID=A0A556MMQ6_9FLAO|nr:aminotransferase class V-fold PLP-dependent enzyme [Fluviicola chungangensis]TSJ41220.1 aminotransferase class V-fold PLP-dependent enzyme [Fluviicola chungangensis]